MCSKRNDYVRLCIRVCYVYVQQRRLTIFWLRIIIKKKQKQKKQNRCKNIDNVLGAYNLLRFGGSTGWRLCVCVSCPWIQSRCEHWKSDASRHAISPIRHRGRRVYDMKSGREKPVIFRVRRFYRDITARGKSRYRAREYIIKISIAKRFVPIYKMCLQ